MSTHPPLQKDIEKIHTKNEINYMNMEIQDKFNLWHIHLAISILKQ